MTLVLTPFLLLAFMFVQLSSHVDQETALAENCLYKAGRKKSAWRWIIFLILMIVRECQWKEGNGNMQLGPGGKNGTTVSARSRLDLSKPVVKPFFVVEKLIFILSSGDDLMLTEFLTVVFFKEAWASLAWTVWEYLVGKNTQKTPLNDFTTTGLKHMERCERA